MPQEPKIGSIEDAAKLLRVHPGTLYRLLKVREIPGAFRSGRLWRFDLRVLEDLVAADPTRAK